MTNINQIQRVLSHLQRCSDYYEIKSIIVNAIDKIHHPAQGWITIELEINAGSLYHSMNEMITIDNMLKKTLLNLSWELSQTTAPYCYDSWVLRIQIN
jgi:hypothetical protein